MTPLVPDGGGGRLAAWAFEAGRCSSPNRRTMRRIDGVKENRETSDGGARLLLVAYDFPPVTSAGIYRIVGMCKHLTELGWDVTVLTVKNAYVHSTKGSLDLIPAGLRVIRTPTVEPARIRMALNKWIRSRTDKSRAGDGFLTHATVAAVRRIVGALQRIEDLVLVPDRKAGWFWFLFFTAWRLIRTNRYDAVLTSGPPNSVHTPFLLLRKVIRFRWVVDFRDPWTIPRRKEHMPWRRLQERMERQVLTACDHIVLNTPGNKRALAGRLGDDIIERATVITNGFDTDRLEILDEEVLDTGADLVYTGQIYPAMLNTYLDAVRLIHDREPDLAPRLRVIGQRPGRVISERISQLGLDAYFDFQDFVPYEAAIRAVHGARGLLLLVPHGKGFETWVPGKLYSYLFAKAPIVFVGPPGDAQEIIAETGRGVAITDSDPAKVASRLMPLVERLRCGNATLDPDRGRIEAYSMANLAMKMDHVLRHAGQS